MEAFMSQVRLDKWLCEAGLGTRSQVKEYLKKGRITVNGITVKKPETKVSDEKDEILFDHAPIWRLAAAYYMFHKPAGCITAASNEKVPAVMDYFRDAPEKDLSPVGRLDKDTEGFLLITNDGPLNHFLLSPKRHVEKTYYVRAFGQIDPDAKDKFQTGLDIGDEKTTLPAFFQVLKEENGITELLITLREGRFHQVKRMVAAVGGEVLYLKRISFGSLPLDESLEKGQYRRLTEEEVMILKDQAGQRSAEEHT